MIPASKTKKQYFELIRSQLEMDRATFMPTWRTTSEYISPRRARFTISDVNKGDRRSQNIIDSTASLASRTLRAGMMSGVTSPARPWFRLTTPDPNLSEVHSVKQWLYDVQNILATSFLRGNLYNSLPIVYGDLGDYGTAAMLAEEVFNGDVMHTSPFAIGSYMIAKDQYGRVNTFIRDFRMSVAELIEKFGRLDGKGEIDWSIFSDSVKSRYQTGQLHNWVDVCHVIMPNWEYDENKVDSKYKKFVSCYYERGASVAGSSGGQYDDNKFLRESGYDIFPVLCPRWEVTGEDSYATNCPGLLALGDVKQLQLGERRSMEAIEKMVRPPMVGPSSLRNHVVSILPGDITYQDVRESSQGLRPAHETNFRIDLMEAKQDRVRQRISRAYFEDLFLMLANSDRREITAREIEERHEEKLLALGPVLEQLNQDLLDPLIDIAFEYHMRQGLLPPPPEELQGMKLKIEYISVMAQAQKMVGIAGVDRFLQSVGQIAQFDPKVIDKLNTDQAVDHYGDLLSVIPNLIRSDEEVAAMREEQAKAVKAAQTAENVAKVSGAAKNLAQAPLDGDNALTAMLGQMGGQ